MTRRFGFYLTVFIVVAAVEAWAQDQSSSAPSQQEPSQTESQPEQSQPSPTTPWPSRPASSTTRHSTTTPTTPAPEEEPAQQEGPKPEYVQVTPARGNTPKTLGFLGAALPESNLSFGLNAQGTYNGNIAAFSKQRQSQTNWLVGANLGIAQYRPKLGLNFTYAGGLGLYDQLSNGNTYSQTLNGDVLYQLTSRWQAHARDSFVYTANPFGSYYTIQNTPTPESPNPNIYVPFPISQQNMVGLDLVDVLSQYDSITFTGSEYYRRFSNYAYTNVYATGLYNTIEFSGGANYSHRVSAKFSMGGGYNWTSLDFSHGAQRSGISAFEFFANYQLNKSFSISGFAGPEYITAKTIIPYFGRYYILQQNDWVPAFGLTLGWQGLRNSALLGLSRQVSDGGGLLATTTVYSLNGSWHRKLSAHWDGTLFLNYSNNASFAASQLNRRLFPDRKFTVGMAGLTLTRPITQRVAAHLTYTYFRETQKAIYLPPATGSYNSNNISVQVSYSLNKPLGR